MKDPQISQHDRLQTWVHLIALPVDAHMSHTGERKLGLDADEPRKPRDEATKRRLRRLRDPLHRVCHAATLVFMVFCVAAYMRQKPFSQIAVCTPTHTR